MFLYTYMYHIVYKQMLTVFQSNKAALKFYHKIGFEVDEQDPSHFGMHEEDYMIMSRPLPPPS